MIPSGDVAAEAPGPIRSGRRFALPRLLVIVLLLVAAGAAGALFWSQQARVFLLEGQTRALRGHLAQVQEEAESLKAQLARQETAQRALTGQLDAAQRTAAEAQRTVATLQQQQAESAARYTSLQGEQEALAAQLATTVKERDEMRRRVAALQAAQEALEQRRQALEQRYASLMRANAPMLQPPAAGVPAGRAQPGAIELPPIVVHHSTPSPLSPPEPPATGAPARLVEVNERYNFVVLDQGSAEGVEPGMVFAIVRGGDLIGSATVRQVREHLSACDVEPSGETTMRCRIGDTAVPQRD